MGNKNDTYAARGASKLSRYSYTSLAGFLHTDDRPALRDTNSDGSITHTKLRQLTTDFKLPVDVAGQGKHKITVAVALPNGPLLAAVCIAVATYYVAAPINPAAGPEQFRSDALQANAGVVLITAEDYEKLQLGLEWVEEAGIKVFVVDGSGGDINIRSPDGELIQCAHHPKPNSPDDIALVLFTSGTSGTRKVVPWTVRALVTSTMLVIDSWGLGPTDICLNMMPLHHIGGLVRNILAPVFSRGSTVCCPVFDASQFWDIMDEFSPTWYFASPSMHTMILSEGESRTSTLSKSRIRLVCNAAGGLLPSLASRLCEAFHCVVLPSYGMTECLPISTPPLDYQLDRDGTSGISAGPELTILDGSHGSHVPAGKVGRIHVRGGPLFQGYLNPDGSLDKSCFTADGWFDTGDLGHLDNEGYLFITGRTKEVINRGGEIISPFEVENAIMSAAAATNHDSLICGRISQALAFSVRHDILQESVAVVLVTPLGVPRVDVKTLQASLRLSLQQAKWPMLIVYMDDLPKKNNKALRINLAHRLGLPEMTDDMPDFERHWEARCPSEASVSEPILSNICEVDLEVVAACMDLVTPPSLMSHVRSGQDGQGVQVFIAPAVNNTTPIPIPLDPALADQVRHDMYTHLHNYMVPSRVHLLHEPFPKNSMGFVDEQKLTAVLENLLDASADELLLLLSGDSTRGKVIKIFADVLNKHPNEIPSDADFFSVGGDSFRAGRLASALRSAFKISFPVQFIFTNNADVAAITDRVNNLIESRSITDDEDDAGNDTQQQQNTKTYSSTNPFLLAIQLVPLAVVYPMRRSFQWTLTIILLNRLCQLHLPTSIPSMAIQLSTIITAIAAAGIIARCIVPLVGILAKWIIIGRYREGLYPMWGFYHTRWWLVQKIVSICGKGMFIHSHATTRLYYRLLGTKIGRNVKINNAVLGEWDLIEIGDNTALRGCTCRPFAPEPNTTMYLGRIVIGSNCSVATASIIAPGSEVPPNTCIGANSSSWETEDAREEYRDLAMTRLPRAHWLLTMLCTYPLLFISRALSIAPWAAGIACMLKGSPLKAGSSLQDALEWYASPGRINFHFLALILRTCLRAPIVFLFAVVVRLLLQFLFGRPAPGLTKDRGAVDIWRSDLFSHLLPHAKVSLASSLVGQHYETTSMLYRMMGAKVGKRVYWPVGSQIVDNCHFLEVGNDVIFGSHAHVITTDGVGSAIVSIGNGAMVADRAVLLPGVTIGAQTVMGSGALGRRDQLYRDGGTYVGSKGGDAVCFSTGSNVRRNSETAVVGRHRRAKKKSYSEMGNYSSSSENLTSPQVWSQDEREIGSSDDSINDDSNNDSNSNSNSNSELPDEVVGMTPFGRAFYMKQAPYHVVGQFTIFCYRTFAMIFAAAYWNFPIVAAIQLASRVLIRFLPEHGNIWLVISYIFCLTTAFTSVLTLFMALLAFLLIASAHWIIHGQRTPGNYDWDKSSYCQRWQFLLAVEAVKTNPYDYQNILALITGTRWMVWFLQVLGAKIGKDCALYAGGTMLVPMTEPDLVTIGDRTAMDDASLVAHINSRGTFDLNFLKVGSGCVLRTGSRLLSGASMEDGSCLLEHTLVMSGDVVEGGWTMQGWPAERWKGSRLRVPMLGGVSSR